VVVGAGVVGLGVAIELAAAGRSVALLEAARTVGEGTSGRSTGKLSLLQGTRLSETEQHRGTAFARSYVDGCREALAWLLEILAEADVPVEPRTALTWAIEEAQVRQVLAEHESARRVGLDTHLTVDLPAGLPGHAGVLLEDQCQVDPLHLLAALAARAEALGVDVRTGHRVRSVSGDPPTVTTTAGATFHARSVVVTTGLPILDRSGAFALTHPHRSYIAAFETDDEFATMAISAGSPAVSLRSATSRAGDPLLLVGGFGHVTGRGSAGQHLDTLRTWARRHLSVGAEVAAWSAQDQVSPDRVPLVGRAPGPAPVHVVTGLAKWGLLAGPAAGRRLARALVSGDADRTALPVGVLRSPSALASVAGRNGLVLADLATGWAGAELRGPTSPPEGSGAVHRGVPPQATSTVEGRRRTVSAVCTHLGGIVRWNDVERSWDCPLHGSRFGSDGEVLEGPATCGLRSIPREPSPTPTPTP
jgi:glycine/D-amino acid oxidase-like deaminating enzyme